MATADANAVALKLPQFWSNLPGQWFSFVEAQFNTRHIVVEKTKYDCIISHLSQEAIMKVYDVMLEIANSIDSDEPINDPYTRIKKCLIERHSLSESSRIETLLSGIEIGDMCPSEFFRSLKTLAGTSEVVSDKLIFNLWSRRLPPLVQASLKALPKAEISDQLSMADGIFEIHRQQQRTPHSINSISNTHDKTIDDILSQNRRLEKEMSELRGMFSRWTKDNDRKPNRSRSRSRSRVEGGKFCWYHTKYGNKATKCNKPCSFKNSPN